VGCGEVGPMQISVGTAPLQLDGVNIDTECGQQARPQSRTSDADPFSGVCGKGVHGSSQVGPPGWGEVRNASQHHVVGDHRARGNRHELGPELTVAVGPVKVGEEPGLGDAADRARVEVPGPEGSASPPGHFGHHTQPAFTIGCAHRSTDRAVVPAEHRRLSGGDAEHSCRPLQLGT
jgi:hypothetical protein